MTRVPYLSPSSYLILGLLDLKGPCTPYGIDRAIAGSIGYFWSFPRSQVYAETERLASLGLATEQREMSGRRRRLFALTDAGSRSLHRWLTTPSDEPTRIHDEALLRLFFSRSRGHADDVIRLADEQRRLHRARLAEFDRLDRSGELTPGGAPRLTLELGIRFERLAVEYWTEVAEGALAVRPESGD